MIDLHKSIHKIVDKILLFLNIKSKFYCGYEEVAGERCKKECLYCGDIYKRKQQSKTTK